MTEQEMMIRAREACITAGGSEGRLAAEYRNGDHDIMWGVQTALRALLDLDKPLPIDPDLLEAREICAKHYAEAGSADAAVKYRAGGYDDSFVSTLAHAGIKRGRALAAGDA
jgi:hypothetical protein